MTFLFCNLKDACSFKKRILTNVKQGILWLFKNHYSILYICRVNPWCISIYNSAHTHTLIQVQLINHLYTTPKCRSQRLRETSLHQVLFYVSLSLSLFKQACMHANSFRHDFGNSDVIRNSVFIVSWFQDTQLTRIPQQKERCSLVQRRKERGASLRDGKHLKGNTEIIITTWINHLTWG